MKKKTLLWLVLGLGGGVLLAALVLAVYLRVMPVHNPDIVDNAGALSAAQLSMLDNVLDLVERGTGTRIGVVLVPSLRGQSLDEYAAGAAQAWWKVHRWQASTRVLMLVSVGDGQVHWDVGSGLQNELPEAVVRHIIDENMVPYLHEGKVDDALYSAFESIFSQLTLVRTETDWPFLHRVFDKPSDATGLLGYGLLILLGIIGLNKMVTWGKKKDEMEHAHRPANTPHPTERD